MDKLFDTLEEGDKTTMAEPTQAIRTPLYPHQKQALNWMMCKENNEALPPFWEKRGKRYYNSLTESTRSHRPSTVHGGILADDMGLGKTLEVISLILTNFHDGQPLAVPLAGLRRCDEPSKSNTKTKKSAKKTQASTSKIPASETNPTHWDMFNDCLANPENYIEDSDEEEERKAKTLQIFQSKGPKVVIKQFVSSSESEGVTKSKSWLKNKSRCVIDDDDDDDIIKGAKPRNKSRRIIDDDDSNSAQCIDLSSAKHNDQVVTDRKVRTAAGILFDLFKSDSSSNSDEFEEGKVIPVDHESHRDPKSNHSEIIYISDDSNESTTDNSDLQPVGYTRYSSTSKIFNTGNKSVRKKEKKQKINEQFGIKALAQSALPADINDENHSPSTKDDDVSDDSDEDWLPDLAMEIPFNCNKAVMGHCDSTTGRTKSDKPRTTLIVCPLSVMNNWLSQLKEHVRDDVKLEIYTYYGKNRTTDCKLLENQDVVISSYNTIASDFKGTGRNPIRQVHWLRIILDEGHYIRNSDTLVAMAMMELKAERRWVLTGTPIQNYLKDLHSLVTFLNIIPLTEKWWWRRTIECPTALGDFSRLQALMTNIGLRRTKNQQVNGKPLIELPARNVFIETIKFSDEEQQVYTDMEKRGQLIIRRYFQQGTLLKQYMYVLVILLRLRQLCCHQLLCSKAALGVPRAMGLLGFSTDGDNQQQDGGTNVIDDETKKKLIDALVSMFNGHEECSICFDNFKGPVITRCGHVYCRTCIEMVFQNTNTALCPLCRGEIKSDQLIEIPEKSLQEQETLIVTDENWQSSSKVDALMKALVQQRSADPTVKSMIVSQFTSLLTLIEVPLKWNGFKFTRLDGTMTNKKRVDNIEKFMDSSPDSPTVFLLSLKAGGVGLNLMAASRVFLMDPAWNPAAEEQCFDRCHRLGQKRDVIITKFVIENSVEERMLALQERKRALMNEAFRKKKSADERRNDIFSEIKALFNL